ncbi:MAG: DUF433 domain-containing protein [Blastocatellia bacterium]|nr:DUF433 domain-containing protein [Blastocatellia bacterium]
MNKAYVELHDGGWWLVGTRVSLDSIVYAFWRGASAETIRSSFPALTLEQVYGAIAFYLSRRQEVDEYLQKSAEEYEAARHANHERFRRSNPGLLERLAKAKDEARLTHG